jgi:uncharacterized membrane protein
MFSSKLTPARRKSRRGAIVVMVAVSIAVVFAFVAIAVDGGWLLELRRKSQATADAAAALVRNLRRVQRMCAPSRYGLPL